VNFVNRSGNVLFWVLALALVPLLVAPLLVGHVVVRLLIARMRRRPEHRQAATPDRAIAEETSLGRRKYLPIAGSGCTVSGT